MYPHLKWESFVKWGSQTAPHQSFIPRHKARISSLSLKLLSSSRPDCMLIKVISILYTMNPLYSFTKSMCTSTGIVIVFLVYHLWSACTSIWFIPKRFYKRNNTFKRIKNQFDLVPSLVWYNCIYRLMIQVLSFEACTLANTW